MSEHEREDALFRLFCQPSDTTHEAHASSRLKARIYSRVIGEQQKTGPLQSLSGTRTSGHGLCIFESLVQIAPIGERAKSHFFCRTCHARVLAEKMENAPIFWSHCPYVAFQDN